MSSASAVAVLSSPTEPRLEDRPSFVFAASIDSVTAANLLATATSLVVSGTGTGQSSKSTEALITQKQHQLAYIQQQQRIQQEKQRQLIYSQQQRHQQYLRFSGQLSFATTAVAHGKNKATGNMSKVKELRTVDLVDDVWRLVFYILACDCKDLGRAMQVSRRFHNLIANDALLWRLTYKLTISGSIFSGQKPLLSPSWIREQQQAGQEASGSLSSIHLGRSKSASNGVLPHMLDRNGDGLDSMPSNTDEHRLRRGSTSHWGAESSFALCGLDSTPAPTLNALASSRSQTGSQSTGALQPNKSSVINKSVRISAVPVEISPGLQMPSPLILPHHRRIAQSMTAMNYGFSSVTAPAQVASASSTQPSYFTGTSSTNGSTGDLGHTTTTRTPVSTPATASVPSFASTLPPYISQVASSSSSTTPIRVIQHHIPSTTFKHHSPAVYWKHQVVEWLEQEKLRCLRLGLFWGFNAATSRAHGRKTNRTR